jgi:type IV secretion system protein VirB10
MSDYGTTAQEPGAISSVNERGNEQGTQSKKLVMFGALLAVVLAIVWGAATWLKSTLNAARTQEKDETVQLDTQRRTFEPNRVQPQAAPCTPIAMLDKSGRPMLGADGQPLKVDCDGRVLGVPAIEPRSAPGRANQPAQRDPYRGDMMVRAPQGLDRAAASLPPMPPPPDFQALQRTLQGITNPRAGSSPGAFMGGGEAAAPGSVSTSDARTGVANLLRGTQTPTAKAALLTNRPYLLPKGRQIDCAMTTRTISEVSGFSSCIVTSNVYSEDGRTLLIERGSEVQGEYGALMRRGQRRLFVLWDRLRTPQGVTMNLASPAADGLGTMGLPGHVDNRWFERIGSALLLSIVLDEVNLSQRDRYGSSEDEDDYARTRATGSSALEMVLADSINIPPVLYANQGARVSIYAARDIDFSGVYAIR